MKKAKVWKYTKEKPAYTGRFIKLIPDEPKELKITDWNFEKHPSGYGFKSYVTNEDGNETDKIWIVWEYDLMMLLKKKFQGKKTHIPLNLRVTIIKGEKPDYKVEIL